jgi:sulfur carrier protein ThiS
VPAPNKICITLKCFAFLGQYLPPGSKGNTTQLEVKAGKTIAQLIDDLNIDQDVVELAILNEQFIDLRARSHAELKNSDTLALWPEVAGG